MRRLFFSLCYVTTINLHVHVSFIVSIWFWSVAKEWIWMNEYSIPKVFKYTRKPLEIKNILTIFCISWIINGGCFIWITTWYQHNCYQMYFLISAWLNSKSRSRSLLQVLLNSSVSFELRHKLFNPWVYLHNIWIRHRNKLQRCEEVNICQGQLK